MMLFCLHFLGFFFKEEIICNFKMNETTFISSYGNLILK